MNMRITSRKYLIVWQQRLNHAGVSSIVRLLKSGAVTSKHSPKVSKGRGCESCILDKQTKQTLSTNTSRSNEPEAVIHSDLCGPMSVNYFSGCKYFVPFVDDYTGFVSVYPIRRKSDSLEQSKYYHGWIDKKYGKLWNSSGSIMVESTLHFGATDVR